MNHDDKLTQFMDTLLKQLLKDNPSEKVVIFSEYRATQDYIQAALIEKLAKKKFVLLRGGIYRMTSDVMPFSSSTMMHNF